MLDNDITVGSLKFVSIWPNFYDMPWRLLLSRNFQLSSVYCCLLSQCAAEFNGRICTHVQIFALIGRFPILTMKLCAFSSWQRVLEDRMQYCLSRVAGDVAECDMCAGTGRCQQRNSDSIPLASTSSNTMFPTRWTIWSRRIFRNRLVGS